MLSVECFSVQWSIQSEWSCTVAVSCNDWTASERSSAWLERVVWVHEVAGSNPVAPTIFIPLRCSPSFARRSHFSSIQALANILFHGQKEPEKADRTQRVEFYFSSAIPCHSTGLNGSPAGIFRMALALLKARQCHAAVQGCRMNFACLMRMVCKKPGRRRWSGQMQFK
jgi:hypothetical protein